MKRTTLALTSAAALALAAGAHGQLLGAGVNAGLGGDLVGGVPAATTAQVNMGASHGLMRVGHTALGVPVFAPRAAAAVVIGGPAYVRRGPAVIVEHEVFVPPAEVDRYMGDQQRAFRRDVEGSGVTVERRGDLLVLEMPSDVTFAFNKSDIQPRFNRVLTSVARTIDHYRGTDVEIMGHTDAVGSDAYNYALSERRAGSVADFLAGRGADSHQLVVEGFGKTEPIASNATIEGRAANRRVEIVLHARTS